MFKPGFYKAVHEHCLNYNLILNKIYKVKRCEIHSEIGTSVYCIYESDTHYIAKTLHSDGLIEYIGPLKAENMAYLDALKYIEENYYE